MFKGMARREKTALSETTVCGRDPNRFRFASPWRVFGGQVRPIPKGLRPPAQGCEERGTLGNRFDAPPTPTGLWLLRHEPSRNPFGVGARFIRNDPG